MLIQFHGTASFKIDLLGDVPEYFFLYQTTQSADLFCT